MVKVKQDVKGMRRTSLPLMACCCYANPVSAETPHAVSAEVFELTERSLVVLCRRPADFGKTPTAVSGK